MCSVVVNGVGVESQNTKTTYSLCGLMGFLVLKLQARKNIKACGKNKTNLLID